MAKQKYAFESKIHVYRATRRMTQAELAEAVGVSRQTIAQPTPKRRGTTTEGSSRFT